MDENDLASKILTRLSEQEPILSAAAFPNVPFVEVKAALDRLGSRSMVSYEQLERDEALLTPEGQGIVDDGSHEARVFEAVKEAVGGLKIADLPGIVGKASASVGQGRAFKEGWIKKDKDRLVANRVSIRDDTREQLKEVSTSRTHSNPKIIADLRKRKLVTLQKVITFKIMKGPKYAPAMAKEETDLTADMIATGAWKTTKFKPYNFKAQGVQPSGGALHPLNKVRSEFRQIFFEMGFSEMPTNHFVESGFWNFDALFVPQQHPARDLQDTFYVADPPRADPPRADPDLENTLQKAKDSSTQSAASKSEHPVDFKQYWDNIRAVHESGKYGSIGYRYPWSPDESLRLVLRTHTTAVSTYMLHKLAADPRPARMFSIDRVFRNESVDATHLAEFHQVEGVIADYGLSLGGLMGFMEVFFNKMGINNLRFKPAYNPYTEPSLEIFGYHEGLAKWVEIGNSGMFRPEMLLSMGLPEDMRVYGWGLSLERPTMIKYGVNNIRELLGHKVDLDFIESNPAVRLDKD